MVTKLRLLMSALAIVLSLPFGANSASQFYIFPVREIEGASLQGEAKIRPIIDRRATSFLTPTVQKEVLDHFASRLASAYPESIVHARQAGDAIKGKHSYLPNGGICGEGFVAPLRRSYAVVIGLTRASYYEVSRVGDRTEVLIPITLNIQLVKPDTAKVIASASDTLYSTFVFGRNEVGTDAAKAKISSLVMSGIKKQIDDLLGQIKKSFSPKEEIVKILENVDGYYVVDKGFEIGFKDGDEPVAISKKDGKELVFRVVSADSGYSVLRLVPGSGSPRVGEEYVFLFESQADDSRKPKLLPVTTQREGTLWTNSIADILVKDIGFKAPFQLSPVDANFRDTMNSITAQANCVPWDKFPASKTIADSRTDHPQFLMRLDYARSPVATLAGVGGVKSTEAFMSVVSAQVLDLDGNIIFSDVASDSYKIERTAGQGISQINAFEVSMKNAAVALSKQLAASLKLEPAEFRISKVDSTQFEVDGLSISEDAKKLSYEVIRPLNVKVGGKPVVVRLQLGEGQGPPKAQGNNTIIQYSKLEDVPKRGDIVRVRGMPRKGQVSLTECKETFKGAGSMDGDFYLPFTRHAAYKSQKHRIAFIDNVFYDDTNLLLDAGFFKHRVKAPALSEVCVKSGYLLKVENSKCSAESCNAQFLSAMTIIQEKAGARVANFVQAEKVSIEGFSEREQNNFIGLKALESAAKSHQKLTEKFNTTK